MICACSLRCFCVETRTCLRDKHTKMLLQVHRGFIWAWESVTAQISDLVLACTARSVSGTRWKVICTGHSLGGALATLSAFDFAVRRCPPHPC